MGTEAVRRLVEAEVADDRVQRGRMSEDTVRCVHCDIRYGERQEYGCEYRPGSAHLFWDAELREAREAGEADWTGYVTLKVEDLMAALDESPKQKSATFTSMLVKTPNRPDAAAVARSINRDMRLGPVTDAVNASSNIPYWGD